MTSKPLLFLALVFACGPAPAQVTGENGRITLRRPTGELTTLTTSGRDSEPWITPDGKTVLFIRTAPDDIFSTSVYAVDTQSLAERLVFKGPARYGGRENAYLGRPEFDATQQNLFLLSHEYATSGALLAVDMASGDVRLVTDAAGYDVIHCGQRRDDLLVFQRKQDILGFPFYLYRIYSPDGQDLGLAGPDGMDTWPLRDPACEYVRGLEEEEGKENRATAPQTSRHGPAPLRVDGKTMAEKLRFRVEPEYPAEARARKIEGTVRLLIAVASDGSVSQVDLISGPPQLAGAAMSAARQWKYEPFLSNGRAVEVVTEVAVLFVLPK